MVSIIQNPVRDQWLGKRDLAGHQKAARVYYIFYGRKQISHEPFAWVVGDITIL